MRAVVLDPADRILLVRFTNPFTVSRGGRRRVVASTKENPWGPQLVRQVERYYLVRARSADLSPGLSAVELAAENVDEVRWWALSELESTEETLAPRALPALLRSLLEEGLPPEPIDAGV